MLIDFSTIIRKYGRPTGILHVGANTGQEAVIYDGNGVKKVVWIEALPEVYEKLLNNLVKYTYQIAINACVHEMDGKEVMFYESNNEAQSSSFLELGTHKTAHPEVHYVKEHKMTTVRLDTLLNNSASIEYRGIKGFDFSDLDMLAMDIQGAEMLALKGLGDKINQFKYVYLEVNTNEVYKGCALMPEIDKYLKSFGFEKKDEKIFKSWGWGDCLWIKK